MAVALRVAAGLVCAALACAGPCKSPAAEIALSVVDDAVESRRNEKSLESRLPTGCLYGGRWHAAGAAVAAGAACLQCRCARGALSCRRRACAALPDPPPHRCHVLHRRDACCPELHCADGITLMEHGASARLEEDDGFTALPSLAHSCVEGGTIYAAGSAMRSRVACEQCFCLGGARRCVRPRCLPPPPGCAPRPAPGACCPQRYYCDHAATEPPLQHPHDCKIDTKWVNEGERVVSGDTDNCTQCFCLRGAVQCHALTCAPPLMGCEPLTAPGECCPHHYRCQHNRHESHILTSNSLTATRNDDRSFHASKSQKQETTTKNILTSIFTAKSTQPLIGTKNHLVSTTKVKRKTSEPPLDISSQSPNQTTSSAQIPTVPTQETTTLAEITSTTETSTTSEVTTELSSTEQPEGSVRIVINGTINCTAELSSTSLPLNVSLNHTEKIMLEAHPRIPLIDVSSLEDNNFSPNDIITDRSVNGGFDENESFVINVTSSLNANTNHTSTKRPVPTIAKVSDTTNLGEAQNNSKKTKGDYGYDYTEPTLPPSLPNLKIIPFVAADAVVDDDHVKETLTYPILEREDKFPVYYPTADTKDAPYATRRGDVYHPTQYPVFITDKPDQGVYPSLNHDIDFTNSGYSKLHSELDSSMKEFKVSASLGNRVPDNVKVAVTQTPLRTTTYKLETPAVNLFSPPVETEGGFVPKGPSSLIDEYYAVFPSTPAGPPVPHLTTSMPLDISDGSCVSSEGGRVRTGASVVVSCSQCSCEWGELRCVPRDCRALCAGPDPAADRCCVCDEDNITTPKSERSTEIVYTSDRKDIKNKTETYHVASQAGLKIPNVTTEPFDSLEEEQDITHSLKNTSVSDTINRNTTQRATTKTITTTTTPPPSKDITQISNQSLEYEDDEDEGFSFGSVLKLLLSDSYESTTTPPKPPPTTKTPPTKIITSTTRRPRPTLPAQKPTVGPFIPLPINSYIPSKKNQNPINRIDHLVLGEATAIRKTTPRPVAATIRHVPSSITQIVTVPTERMKEETYTTQEAPRPPGEAPGIGAGLLKLAGCNIYGRMYRVGRIIAELSTPCQECWCTDTGVDCKQLKC